jgi:hypothetical protein
MIRWFLLMVCVLFAWRVLEKLDLAIQTDAGTMAGAGAGAVLGFIVVGVLCAVQIQHRLVDQDTAEQIKKAKSTGEARKW